MGAAIYVYQTISGCLDRGESAHFAKTCRIFTGTGAAQLELMGISMSREIISQMESGHHNIRISVLLAFKQVYEVDSFDDFFVQQEKGGDR